MSLTRLLHVCAVEQTNCMAKCVHPNTAVKTFLCLSGTDCTNMK